ACHSFFAFFFSSRRRHTRSKRDWSSDVCSSDLQGVGDHGQTGDVDQVFGDRGRGGARRQADGAVGLHEFGGGSGDGLFFVFLAGRLGLESGFGGAGGLDGDRATVHLADRASTFQGVEVTADGHVRHQEALDEVGDAHPSVTADPFQDHFLSLRGKHLPPWGFVHRGAERDHWWVKVLEYV